ncbi:glycoside hydrolase family 43 protein [Paenibacillus allorhizosphaerae]|uniref:DUF7402 domain-containing protein n=1 Tax=Paenibacillus allorhizosphaerae TaxID=2849866 RepID=A0ABM8VD07_9BACL|nr:glycoside hydrolase family 43 protein [Paenibacillus allorhizosphaerae]CAG7625990.1 hypothetical protein PAECIP111802_01205 [Paenibacillus allorhizosphaerae]
MKWRTQHIAAMVVLLLAGCTSTGQTNGPSSQGAAAPPAQQASAPAQLKSPSELPKNLFYTNPVIKRGADPGVFRASDGKYYAYPTGGGGFRGNSSSDLVQWKDEGQVLKAADTFGDKNFWAPQVLEYKGKFYMFYSAGKGEGKLHINVAVADSPKGPFKDMLKEPLLNYEYSTIDPYVLIDDNGKIYMYYSNNLLPEGDKKVSSINVVELNEDMSSIKSGPITVAKPEQSWEMQSGNNRWNEGAFVLKHDGTYYLMFSANCYCNRNYSVGYATSKSPTGPFVKYKDNPIMSAEHTKVSGPGHHSIIPSPDGKEWWIMYHTHIDVKKGGGDRQLNIDRIGFRSDGSIYVNGPTITGQMRPSGTTGKWKNIAGDAKVSVSSTKQGFTEKALNDGEIGLYRRFDKYDWVANNETAGAWAQLTWPTQRVVKSVLIYESASGLRALQTGKIILDDGTEIKDIEFPTEPGAAAIVNLAERKVKSIKVVIEKALTNETGLSEIVVIGE